MIMSNGVRRLRQLAPFRFRDNKIFLTKQLSRKHTAYGRWGILSSKFSASILYICLSLLC